RNNLLRATFIDEGDDDKLDEDDKSIILSLNDKKNNNVNTEYEVLLQCLNYNIHRMELLLKKDTIRTKSIVVTALNKYKTNENEILPSELDITIWRKFELSWKAAQIILA